MSLSDNPSSQLSSPAVPTSRCVFQNEPGLATEILVQIISYLDPPSAVCFALTCHNNYNAVLLACDATRLERVCPRDVRKPLPKAIEPQAFNILTLKEQIVPVPKAGSVGYYNHIKNLHYIPATANNRLPEGYTPTEKHILVGNLAFIRNASWRLAQGWALYRANPPRPHRAVLPTGVVGRGNSDRGVRRVYQGPGGNVEGRAL